MSREPTFGSTGIRNQFNELASLIDRELTVYLIGGGALTLMELKNATKDIDLIVRDQSELKWLWDVLISAGYEPEDELSEAYEKLDAAFILEKDRRRFDVFHEQVAGVIYLSDGMVSRSHHLFDEGELSVRRVSLNDIFLFKAVANRDDDVDDMIRIAEAGIDTEVIVEEIETQLDFIEGDAFIGSMKHKLDRLKDEGYIFDIHDEIETLYASSQDGVAVSNAMTSLLEHEYDDNLYAGVPETRIEQRVGKETASSGVEWLVQIGRIQRASDGSLVFK